MKEQILNWMIDTTARIEILDLYFVVSDLIDIPVTDQEKFDSAYYDSMCNQTAGRAVGRGEYTPGTGAFGGPSQPNGKKVY